MSNPKKAIYYFTQWGIYGRNYTVADIPECVTDIVYAFWNIDPIKGVFSGDLWADTGKQFGSDLGNFGALQSLKKKRKINVGLGIGGWTFSANFSTVVSTEAYRNNFVNSLKDIETTYPGLFDSWCIDWEYPGSDGINYGNAGNVVSPKDSDNFLLLLKAIKIAFPNKGISICTASDPSKIKFDILGASKIVDELHVMTYDLKSSSFGDTLTSHQTNPRKSSYSNLSCEESAKYVISLGVNSSKVFIGGVLYSRGFANSNGPNTPCSGIVSDMSWEAGVCDYKTLPRPGAIEYLDPETKAAYSYDPVKKIVNSYDNPDSIKEKCKIIAEQNLGGIIFWEIDGDYPIDNPKSIIATVRDNLNKNFSGVPVVPIVPIVPEPNVPDTAPVSPVVPLVNLPNTPPNSIDTDILFTGKVTFMGNLVDITLTKNNGKVILTFNGSNSPNVPAVPNVPNVPAVPNVPVPSDNSKNWVLNGNYKIGDIVTYQGNKYVSLIGNNAVAPNWNPVDAASLWKKI